MFSWLKRPGRRSSKLARPDAASFAEPAAGCEASLPGGEASSVCSGDAAEDHDATVSSEGPIPAGNRFYQLNRFRLGALLGQGGMGRVYEAFDPRLKRRVAVKILRGDDPQDVARFLREARAQAAVVHPGICPIFEADAANGIPYIVMQRLHGRPLNEATANRALGEQLELMVRVAEAIEASHRTGLIHRDIKPSNILVESTAEGGQIPYVLDFGLARPAVEGGLTADGALLGTPAYMAPEQVEGDLAALGPWTDVYGLGASLYHVLAGRPPFPGDLSSGLRHILEHEPPPLRPLWVPAEVEAIIFRCLEKEPRRRYESAGALVDDLRRYLQGRPVLARPVGWWYRLRKRARRNAAVVAVSGISAILLLAAFSWGLVSSWQARTRERLARTFTQQVERVDALARYSHLSPLHDVRPDRTQLRQRMESIREAMESGGPLAQGPGHYALGRGHLALEELEDAHRNLQDAWDAGERGPEVAAAMARTLSALYREGLASAELVRDWESRQTRLQDLEKDYGEPAQGFLRKTLSENPAEQPYLAALLLFHESRFQEALDTLSSSRGIYPWSYEVHRLEGDIRRTRAIQQSTAGEREEALAELERAQQAYAAAAAIAQSDPAIHRAASQASALGVSLKLFGSEDVEASILRGLDHAGKALATNPEDGRTWLWKARLHRAAMNLQLLQSVNPETAVEDGVAAARKASALLPEPSEALSELGNLYLGWAQWQNRRGEDPESKIDAATSALAGVIEAWRDYSYYNVLALAHATAGDHRAARGKDATESYEQAISAYRAAAAMHSAPFGALNNMGVILLKLSGGNGTIDPAPLLLQAITAFEAARDLEPDHFAPHYYLGRSYLRLAQGGKETSGRLGESILQSVASYQKAVEVNPGAAPVHSALGEVYHLQATDAWDTGSDPSSLFRLARQSYRRGLEISPDNEVIHQNLAWTAYFQGKYQVREGKDPGPLLKEAIHRAQTALGFSAHPGALLCLGSAYRLQAEYAFLTRSDPSTHLEAGKRAFRRILEHNPRYPEAFRSLGRLHTLEARWKSRSGGNPESSFENGRQALDRALELETEVAAFWLADGRWCLHRADSLKPKDPARIEAISRGLASLERALALRPGWAEGLAAEATLLAMLAAEPATRGSAQGETATRLLQGALAANPHLTFEWKDFSIHQ